MNIKAAADTHSLLYIQWSLEGTSLALTFFFLMLDCLSLFFSSWFKIAKLLQIPWEVAPPSQVLL